MASRCDVAFVYPNYENGVYRGCSWHYGAASVRAAMSASGLSTVVVHAPASASVEETVSAIVDTGAPLVGFTCYDESYYLIGLLAEALKRRAPDVKLIVGGPTATFSDHMLLTERVMVDVGVRGEAEHTLPVLATALLDGAGLDGIPGITWRDGNELRRTADAALIGAGGPKGAELDVLPSPYLSGALPADAVAHAGIQTSRGCVYRCTYCNFTVLSRFRVRYFSVDRVLDELTFIGDRLHAPVARPLPIFDDFFSVNLKRAKAILAGMIDRRLHRRLPFVCETRADAVDREFFALLKEAGCHAINFGLESAVPEVLRAAKKITGSARADFEPEEQFLASVRQAIEWARLEGLHTSVTIILGLPGEDEARGRETIAYVSRLRCDTYGHNFLQVFPGTELARTHAQHGIRVEPSVTGLPLLTHPAYNVAEVPFLASGTLPSVWTERGKIIAAFVSGLSDYASRPAAVLVDMANQPSPPVLASWLRPASEVILDYSKADGAVDPMSDFRSFVAAGVPIVRAVALERNGADRLVSDVNRGARQHAHFATRVHTVRFRDFRRAPSVEPDSDGRTLFELVIESREDLDALGAELDRLEATRVATFPSPWASRFLVLRDACRWTDRPCDETGTERRWMLSAAGVQPCADSASGCAVGLGSVAALRELRERTSDASGRRGCARCSLAESCARCPWPGQRVEDYCHFRRAHRLAPAFERALRVKNGFVRLFAAPHERDGECQVKIDPTWRRPLIYQGRIDDGSSMTDPRVAASRYCAGAFLVRLPRKLFIVSPSDMSGVELNAPLAEIWEALCMGVDARSMEDHFSRRYDLTRSVYRTKLSEAWSMFEGLGFWMSGAA